MKQKKIEFRPMFSFSIIYSSMGDIAGEQMFEQTYGGGRGRHPQIILLVEVFNMNNEYRVKHPMRCRNCLFNMQYNGGVLVSSVRH